MSETHVGPDGKRYATVRCKECGEETHAMGEAWRFYKLCSKCLAEKRRNGEEPKEDES